MKLTYVIKFVGDMDRAVAFHRDPLGLPLIFTSPGFVQSKLISVPSMLKASPRWM